MAVYGNTYGCPQFVVRVGYYKYLHSSASSALEMFDSFTAAGYPAVVLYSKEGFTINGESLMGKNITVIVK
jgi:hypothetical protein